LYASTYTVRVIKSRRMTRARYVARMGEMRNAYNILVGNMKERDLSEDLSVDGKIILECMLEKYSGMLWTGFIWLRIGTSGGVL
jgi:hypothetical protein